MTDFISFISWLPLTATLMQLLLLFFGGFFEVCQEGWVRVPPMTKKFFVQLFSALRDFFANFFNVSKGSPFIFFYFAKEWMFKNSQGPPFKFFGTMRLTGDQKMIEKKFRIFFNFFLTGVL